MNVLKRGCYILAILAPVAAHASVTFSNIDATIKFEDNTTSNLNVVQGGNSLDIFANGTPLTVGDGSGHTSATVTVSYDASSTKALNSLELLFTGWASGTGVINYTESVFDSKNNLLDTVSGTKTDGDPFLQTDNLTFSSANNIHVEKTFTLDLTGNATDGIGGTSSSNFASIGLIEQNAVPEPASMTALALGGLGLIARRRKKS